MFMRFKQLIQTLSSPLNGSENVKFKLGSSRVQEGLGSNTVVYVNELKRASEYVISCLGSVLAENVVSPSREVFTLKCSSIQGVSKLF